MEARKKKNTAIKEKENTRWSRLQEPMMITDEGELK